MIDIDKYGLKLSRTSESGIKFYLRTFKDFTIELMVADSTYSIEYTLHEETVKVANRYHVDTQEQLDFLIYNGRVGWVFKNEQQ